MKWEWTAYDAEQPVDKGVYLWRVPNKHIDYRKVIFYAHMRKRGNGYKPDILSPSFDYWNGYVVSVPNGTEWSNVDETPDLKECRTEVVDIDGLHHEPCPFCDKAPTWKGLERSSTGGVFIGSAPHQYNSWWLECCAYARTPSTHDPLALTQYRNERISAALNRARGDVS